MANEYAPGYPVNTGPAPDGDTVKIAVEKHIEEFRKMYADIGSMYQQILTELQYANVDMVDEKHADNTANNIPVLNGKAELANDVNNSSVKTGDLEVTGTAQLKSLEVDGKTLESLLISRIAIKTGMIAHGDIIPLPAGFTHEECFFTVSKRTLNSGKYSNEFIYADPVTRLVTCRDETNGPGTANYLIIGLKTA